MKRIKSYNRFVESIEFEEGHESKELGGEGDPYCVDCGKSFKLTPNKAEFRKTGGFICPECEEHYKGRAEGDDEEEQPYTEDYESTTNNKKNIKRRI